MTSQQTQCDLTGVGLAVHPVADVQVDAALGELDSPSSHFDVVLDLHHLSSSEPHPGQVQTLKPASSNVCLINSRINHKLQETNLINGLRGARRSSWRKSGSRLRSGQIGRSPPDGPRGPPGVENGCILGAGGVERGPWSHPGVRPRSRYGSSSGTDSRRCIPGAWSPSSLGLRLRMSRVTRDLWKFFTSVNLGHQSSSSIYRRFKL